jgi:hypothetical protein
MRRLPYSGIVHVQVAAERAHHDLTAFHPGPHLDGHAFGTLHLSSILLHRGLQCKRRIAGPHGMIFMGNVGAKQRHDTITHDLIDRALIAMHGSHHALEHRVEEMPGLFWITVGE